MNYQNLRAITVKKETKEFSPIDGISLLICKYGDVLFTKNSILVLIFLNFIKEKKKREGKRIKERRYCSFNTLRGSMVYFNHHLLLAYYDYSFFGSLNLFVLRTNNNE